MLNKPALYYAIEKENIDIVNLILSNKNIDINIPYLENTTYDTKPESFDIKTTSLYLAVKKGNIEIIKILLQNNELEVDTKCFYAKDNRPFNKNVREMTALELAEHNKQVSIIELFKRKSQHN